ncbi:tRNA-guanine transglycosylase, partial [Geobacillus sp. MMMUD3]|nr:tRNA-guanine transglycosylase [Geobacillus sp. MMMUD3]
LYLQPGSDIVDEAGGLGRFMNWPGPTFTDSGGFQVMSLGAGFKKVISMEVTGEQNDDAIAAGKERLSNVDDDGVTFKSHLDGTMHRFTPEVSMRVQHELGADIMFAFDELTTLVNTRGYQETSLERTRLWAIRCIEEHQRLTQERSRRPYQALFGVLQGAQYEDLRRKAARDLGAMDFDGYGIGGALEKENLGTIIRWVCEELPEDKPRHLLGISEPDDLFEAIKTGADTFDCVSPSRVARNAAVYTRDGRYNLTGAKYRRDFGPLDPECDCYTCE